MLKPNFRKLVFGIPFNSTPFNRVLLLQITSNTNCCNMFIATFYVFVGWSFILVLEIIDCSLMMILSLGKVELGMNNDRAG
jgi:hypothetical protein